METIDGYGITVEYDDQVVAVTAANAMTARALLGDEAKSGARSVMLPRDAIELREHKPASALVNGHLILAVHGRVYALHYRKKQSAGFAALADSLQA